MADEGTLATTANVQYKAGANASTTSNVEDYINVFVKQAEGRICMDTRYDWVTNYSNVSDIGKEILRDAVSCYAAIDVINYDMSGFSTRQEALIMINILWARYREIVSQITKDNNYKDFILTGEGDID